MSTYLLLRSNKETGPHTLDDLINSGLRPYDLVWVQGRSAAWRYPSEIEELKPYAPVVEEQPFDRFFKKNSEEKKEDTILKNEIPVAKEEKAAIREIPVVHQTINIEEKYEKYIPKKSVAVTLPAQKKIVVQKPIIEETIPPAPPTPTITVTENPAAAQIKYSQPLDEIKEMYVKTLQERKTRIARKGFVTKNLKRAAVFVGLIAIGLLAGFIIKWDSGKKNEISQQTNPVSPAINSEPDQSTSSQEIKEENNTAAETNIDEQNREDKSPDHTNVSNEVPEQKDQTSTNTKKQPLTNKPEKKKEELIEKVSPSPVETNLLSGERTRALRNDNGKVANTDDAPIPKAVKKSSGLENLVSVSSNNYKIVAFGGIRNLELTVTNESKYTLDKVTVKLEYLKPSLEPLKTENINFHSIAPNETMTLRIPDTNRGIKVNYKIVDIQSQGMASSGF